MSSTTSGVGESTTSLSYDADGDPYSPWLIKAKRRGIYPSAHYQAPSLETRLASKTFTYVVCILGGLAWLIIAKI